MKYYWVLGFDLLIRSVFMQNLSIHFSNQGLGTKNPFFAYKNVDTLGSGEGVGGGGVGY